MNFELLILGSNSAVPYKGRFPSAQALTLRNSSYLIDCGEGTQIRLAEEQVKRNRFKAVFISHLHGDHVFGLPGLLTSFSLAGRKDPLFIFGPQGIREMIETAIRLSGSFLSYPVEFQEIITNKSVKVYESETIKVFAFPLQHRIPTYGYKFVEKEKARHIVPEKLELYNIPFTQIPDLRMGADGISVDGDVIPNREVTRDPHPVRSYAYCSDTIYDESLISHIAGVDLLYHEATFMHDLAEKARDRMHTTSCEAAMIAKKAKVQKLIIGHFSSRYDNLEPLLHEARSVFSNTELAIEGTRFEI
jgi:ribonuclease Z